VYVSNLLIAIGLLLSAWPPWGVAAALFALLAALYAILAVRESRQLARVVSIRQGGRLSWSALARSERSTWLQLALVQGFLLAQL
jgi:hypothetical protein